jgi:catechol 2,3-dioxygenase-like lactoylglutathione lyase family enzyme
MKSAITHVFITVDDHDKGLEYYESVLGFNRTWDVAMDNGWRWLTVSPQGHETCNIVINKASNDAEFAIIGNQTVELAARCQRASGNHAAVHQLAPHPAHGLARDIEQAMAHRYEHAHLHQLPDQSVFDGDGERIPGRKRQYYRVL